MHVCIGSLIACTHHLLCLCVCVCLCAASRLLCFHHLVCTCICFCICCFVFHFSRFFTIWACFHHLLCHWLVSHFEYSHHLVSISVLVFAFVFVFYSMFVFVFMFVFMIMLVFASQLGCTQKLLLYLWLSRLICWKVCSKSALDSIAHLLSPQSSGWD